MLPPSGWTPPEAKAFPNWKPFPLGQNRAQGRRYKCLLLVGIALFIGCGTTRWTDTSRTATEQLLLSDAIDRAVSQLDFRALAGRTVYLDSQPVQGLTDAPYLVSTVRQHLLASGCILKENREEADYVVELRVGALGTDRHDILFGLPATQLPSFLPLQGLPQSIPEIPFIKRTQQCGVAKIALFAYNRKTGRPAWQSGVVAAESKAKNTWIFGAGPFQRGTIYEGTAFAGDKLEVPLIYPGLQDQRSRLSVADEAYFVEPGEALSHHQPTDVPSDSPNSGPRSSEPPGCPSSSLPSPPEALASPPQTARAPTSPSPPAAK